MKKIYPILILKLFCIVVFAQNKSISIKTITKEDGLPTNQVLCIYEDQIGFIWIGNEYGLYRYDGYEFEVYQNDPDDEFSISANSIRCIIEEKETGNLWIGSSGFDYFDRYKNKFYSKPSFELRGGVNVLLYDHKNNLWIATQEGLYRYNANNTINVFRHDSIDNNSLNYDAVSAISEDNENNIWVGTAWSSRPGDLQVYNYETNSFKRHIATPELRDVFAIYPASNGDLWVGSYTRGLFRMKNGGFNKKMDSFNAENGFLINNCAENIVSDEYGNLYISNGNGGLVYFDINKMKSYWYTPDIYNPNSISSKAITSLFKSSSGIIWLGTFNGGINYIDNKSKRFEHYKINFREDGLFNNNIRALFEDMEGNIWIGTKDDGGLSKFNRNKGTFIHFKPKKNNANSLSDDFVLSINELNKDELIIGTINNGFDIFNKQKGIFKHFRADKNKKNSLQNNKVYASYLDDYGILWLACYNLESFDTNTGKYAEFPMLKEPVCFYPESKEEVWVGTKSNGIFLFNVLTHEIKNYQEATGDTIPLSYKMVSSILKDSKGRLLIAFVEGCVSRIDFKSGKFDRFTFNDGLYDNNIFSLLLDEHDNFWVATSSGLLKYNPETSESWIFDKNDGLQGNEFERYVALKTSKGEMIFGGRNGFNIFHPDSITLNTTPPPVVITGLKLFNKPVTVNSGDSILSTNIVFCKEITLKHWQSVITFTFSALNYTSTEKNKYAYMLENFETEWNHIDYQRNATYTSLPAGEYIFRVKASNNDGFWNNEGATIKITMLPPWWETWWIRLFLISLIALALVLIFRRRTIILRRQKQKLQKLVNERTNELKEMNLMLSERKEELEIQMHEMAKMNEELESKSDQVAEMAAKIHEADELKLRFFANISHEFRTPLSLIIAPLDKIRQLSQPIVWDGIDISKYVQLMRKNAQRLLRLINQLIDFRKIDQKAISLKITNNNIIDFISEVVNAFSPMAESKGIQLRVKSEELKVKNEEMSRVDQLITHHSSFITDFWFDPDIMEKILFNIVSNAIKYTPEGGRILIALDDIVETHGRASLQNQLAIKISDTGIGIKPENLNKIFDRFYREEKSDQVANEGAGIGLAYTKELTELHNGTIKAESKKGEGTTFILTFPIVGKPDKSDRTTSNQEIMLDYIHSMVGAIVDEKKETADEGKLISGNNRLNEQNNNKSTILIVEDNTELRKFIKNELSGNFNVIEAENGAEGWDLIPGIQPDLVISDIMMPIMDGIELCKKIKTDSELCHIPVFLLTAKSNEGDQLIGLNIGANDYITKPFNIEVLHAKIQNYFDLRKGLYDSFNKNLEVPVSKITHSIIDKEFLERAIQIIKNSYKYQDFNNDTFIHNMNCGRTVVYNKIKSLTGLSLSEFIRSIRLKEAAKLFQEGEDSIANVCFKVGFKHQSTFGMYFKQMFGKTPKEYVNECLNR